LHGKRSHRFTDRARKFVEASSLRYAISAACA
jgi:hypothetical protein